MRYARSLFTLLPVCLWFICSVQAQDDPRWTVIQNLNALDTDNVTPTSLALGKTLHDAAESVLRWQLPQDAKAWKLRRPEVERAFRKAIGLETLPERTPLNARILATHDFGDYTIQNVVFESRPGFPVTANLYRPKAEAKGKRAAVLCPIGHFLRTGKATAAVQMRCIKLVRMGFVVLVYDAIGHGERLVAGNMHHQAGYSLLPLGETVAGWMVWDSMRALDYMLTFSDVDPNRIGITGNSGGGLNTLYTSALDPRFHVAAIAGYTFQFNNWIKYAGPHCTCTHLPGIYRSMEWFEIAGLIAPRPVLMLQGGEDSIFPVSGARLAGHSVESLYTMLGLAKRARLDIIPGQPHAYSQPYRERMYGWMALHLLGQGNGEPIPEGDFKPLPETDPQLKCDPDGSLMARSPSVIALARKKAEEIASRLAPKAPEVKRVVDDLVAPPSAEPDSLGGGRFGRADVPGGVLEKVLFLSEIGMPVPGLLWRPSSGASRPGLVIMIHERGKQAVAQSGFPEALMKAGYALLALDLRGRGETLGQVNPNRDNNFQFVAVSTLWGFPPAGRRAFDLKRAIDWAARRRDLSLDNLTVVGFGDDALPALLAAAADSRVKQVVGADYFNSLVAQVAGVPDQPFAKLVPIFNSTAIDRGRTNTGSYDFDLGSVIPSILKTADLPDIVSLVAPRKVLYCQTRGAGAPGDDAFRSRFRRVTAQAAGDWLRYEPDKPFDAAMLVDWLSH